MPNDLKPQEWQTSRPSKRNVQLLRHQQRRAGAAFVLLARLYSCVIISNFSVPSSDSCASHFVCVLGPQRNDRQLTSCYHFQITCTASPWRQVNRRKQNQTTTTQRPSPCLGASSRRDRHGNQNNNTGRGFTVRKLPSRAVNQSSSLVRRIRESVRHCGLLTKRPGASSLWCTLEIVFSLFFSISRSAFSTKQNKKHSPRFTCFAIRAFH